jgi:hypothetical protein
MTGRIICQGWKKSALRARKKCAIKLFVALDRDIGRLDIRRTNGISRGQRLGLVLQVLG